MRTKTTVLAAAVLAAGALSSMAQNNVYSLNVVGYVNVSLPSGFSLIANQLAGSPDNKLNTVLGTNLPEGVQLIKWNPATQGFYQPDTLYSAATAGTAGWYDSSFNPSVTTISPGEGVFFVNPFSTTNVTLVGQVTQGTNTVPLSSGYSFVSLVPPLSVDVGTNGPLALPGVEGVQYLTFNSASQSYAQPYTYYSAATAGVAGWYDNTFNPAHLIPAVGQGFAILNPFGATTWTNTFSVQ